MKKFLKIPLILLCNLFLLSSCLEKEQRLVTFATIKINGDVYKHYDYWHMLRPLNRPMFWVKFICERQLSDLTLYLRQQDNNAADVYSLEIIFDSPLQKLKLNEPYNIISTTDTLLYKENLLGFYNKMWENRKHLPTFGSGGYCILSTLGESRVVISLSGTCVLTHIDEEDFIHGVIKLSGNGSSGELYYLEGEISGQGKSIIR